MAILDNELMFSDAQALTATAVSTNVISLLPLHTSNENRDIGVGEGVWLVVGVDVAAGGTSPTMTVALQTDDNEAFSSPTTLFTSGSFNQAAMAAGARLLAIQVPHGVEKYLRLNYTLGGTSPTVTVTSYLTYDAVQAWEPYANNYDVATIAP